MKLNIHAVIIFIRNQNKSFFRKDDHCINGKEMIKLYIEHGWKIKRISKHYIMEKNNNIEPIPYHTQALRKGLEQHLLKRLKEVG